MKGAKIQVLLKHVKEMVTIVDIHTHILPSVDDGAETVFEAEEMLSIAVANGTTDIVVTPHYLTRDMRSLNFSRAELFEAFATFKAKAAERFPGLNLYFGAEVFAVSNIEEYIESKQIITINNTKYVLLEFDFGDSALRALEITKVLQEAGYKVIIAHPERYDFMKSNPRQIVPFLELGAILQVNSTSILGNSGLASQDVALSLLENGLAAIVASDAHSIYNRRPDLSEAYSFVSSNFSFEYADDLFNNNPLAIIKGQRL